MSASAPLAAEPLAPALLAVAAIDPEALLRDRTRSGAGALAELRSSLLAHGLRMPIEVFELANPYGPHRYALISGYRRLTAFASLAAADFCRRWHRVACGAQ